jgi:hypothetical protein
VSNTYPITEHAYRVHPVNGSRSPSGRSPTCSTCATSARLKTVILCHRHVGVVASGGGRPVSSEGLAESTHTNPVYVCKVLGPLRTAGLVRSRPGVYGGWEAATDLQEVREILKGDGALGGAE